MSYKSILPILISACIINAEVKAQVNSTPIVQQFDYYRKTTFNEKLYLHTDKNFYLAGEILWWKAYYVDGVFHKPADISKVAYIEILDAKNKPVMQAKTGLQKGDGNGSFYLPVSLSSGTYTLRAYTNWMKNFGEDFFFEKQITIVNSLKPLNNLPSKSQPSYDIQFFPEGGNLVRDISSKVAFRVTDQYGKGLNFSGALVNDNNDTVAYFTPLKFGLGNFSFTPKGTQTYKAVLKLETGQIITKEFPVAYEKGYTLTVTDNNDNLHLKIATNIERSSGVFAFIHTRQVIKVAMNVSLVNGVAEFDIPNSKLGDGISHITVFDINQQPVCERLYFKKPSDILKIEASSDAVSYSSRQKVNINVHTAVPADMSLSVYKIDSLQTIDENSLQSYLWLTSDLKGTIESPEYYFSSDDKGIKDATENLMLTHGWRRFNWDSILRNFSTYNYVPEFDGQIVTGRVFNAITNRPASGTKVTLSVPGPVLQYYSATSDSNGYFHFDVRGYLGQSEVVITPQQSEGTSYRVEVDNPFYNLYNTNRKAAFTLSETTQSTLNNSSIGMQVQNAFNSEHLSHFSPPELDTLPFFGNHAVRYMLDDYVRFVTMEEVLREYVIEVGIRRVNGKLHLVTSDFFNKGFFSGEPLILLDGIPVSHEAILEYDPLKVSKLLVVPQRYITGQFIYDGLISFTTYDGNHEALKTDPQAASIDYNGLQLRREFFSPVYESAGQLQNRIPDYRNVLYWSPEVLTDKTGNGTIHFYTSDVKGKYIGVIQGLDATGKAGRTVFNFEVAEQK